MKKEYEAPKAEKMDFAYSEVVTASNAGTRCIIKGMTVTWNDSDGRCENSAPGDE